MGRIKGVRLRGRIFVCIHPLVCGVVCFDADVELFDDVHMHLERRTPAANWSRKWATLRQGFPGAAFS